MFQQTLDCAARLLEPKNVEQLEEDFRCGPASVVGVPVETIENILANEPPQDHAIWEHFARYFRINVDFLHTGGPPHSEGLFDLTASTTPSSLGSMRTVPLLRWDQIDQRVMPEEPSRVIHAEAMLDTDVPWVRTFAIQVKDNSIEPLFSEGKVIFANPDLPTEPGKHENDREDMHVELGVA
jgi:hypothetical protein